MKDWAEVLEKILGAGYTSETDRSDMSGRVFAAGESINVFTPDRSRPMVSFTNPIGFGSKLDPRRRRMFVSRDDIASILG